MAIDDAATHAIIGAAMELHSIMGNGFQEVVYQRAPVVEFRQRVIRYRREQEVELHQKRGSMLIRGAPISLSTTQLWLK